MTERNDLSLAQPALSALSALAEAFSEQTGGDRLLLTSAYRTLEYQQGVYDDYVEAYGQAAADKYRLIGIPQIYVLDENNKIIAEGVRGKEIEEAVAKILGPAE